MAPVFGVKEGSRTWKGFSSILGSKCHPPEHCRSVTYVVCQTVLERRCSAAMSAITEQLFCVSCRWQARWECLLCLVQPTGCPLDGPQGWPVHVVAFPAGMSGFSKSLQCYWVSVCLKALLSWECWMKKIGHLFNWVIMNFSNQKLVFLLLHPWQQLLSMLSTGFLPFTSVDTCS